MTLKIMQLFDPSSSGMKVWVMRGWWGRMFYPKDFATLGECKRYRELTEVLDSYCVRRDLRNTNRFRREVRKQDCC